MVAQWSWEAWWLSGNAPHCCPAVPESEFSVSLAHSWLPSSGGLPPGMALGCGLTSVRGDRGENYEKWTVSSPKKYIKKNQNIYHRVYSNFYTKDEFTVHICIISWKGRHWYLSENKFSIRMWMLIQMSGLLGVNHSWTNLILCDNPFKYDQKNNILNPKW
jgi:hypothetical protein